MSWFSKNISGLSLLSLHIVKPNHISFALEIYILLKTAHSLASKLKRDPFTSYHRLHNSFSATDANQIFNLLRTWGFLSFFNLSLLFFCPFLVQKRSPQYVSKAASISLYWIAGVNLMLLSKIHCLVKNEHNNFFAAFIESVTVL